MISEATEKDWEDFWKLRRFTKCLGRNGIN